MRKDLRNTRHLTEYSCTEVIHHLPEKGTTDIGPKSDHAFTPYQRQTLKIQNYENS